MSSLHRFQRRCMLGACSPEVVIPGRGRVGGEREREEEEEEKEEHTDQRCVHAFLSRLSPPPPLWYLGTWREKNDAKLVQRSELAPTCPSLVPCVLR
jgi:hypothetical protein